MAGWLVGLTIFLLFTMWLWRSGQDQALTIAIGVAAAVLVGRHHDGCDRPLRPPLVRRRVVG
ncbi:hypothetical protein KZ829_24555 [Actinoplanes hulinensis]|uniref:Uncharacterized protein n=1 Tax=Actinoplanes hulinensis TaxID=1144547 RepID=A0ABS7B795_9ACTN|nr:hypothetical protein [Actinoplanes hulinensis]MBW6436918.1 hypothetical protein [Actinoplanes hulinensis]